MQWINKISVYDFLIKKKLYVIYIFIKYITDLCAHLNLLPKYRSNVMALFLLRCKKLPLLRNIILISAMISQRGSRLQQSWPDGLKHFEEMFSLQWISLFSNVLYIHTLKRYWKPSSLFDLLVTNHLFSKKQHKLNNTVLNCFLPEFFVLVASRNNQISHQ